MVRGKQGGRMLAREVQETVAGRVRSDWDTYPKWSVGERVGYVQVRR